MDREIRFLSVCGMLGYGYPLENMKAPELDGVAFLGVDAGSTDPGPYYLGSGTNFVAPALVKRDLGPALQCARDLGVPLIIGSAGGGGARPHLEGFLHILRAVAAERDLHFRMAVIPADLEPDVVRTALHEGRLKSMPYGPAAQVSEETIRSCSHIVGQMGTAPIIRALGADADVVVAGRCCDTAIFASLPMARGFDPGLAFHAAKIAECGTLCARPGGANDSLLAILQEDGFCVRPVNPLKRCYPDSVAAHSLYEQPDPNTLHEPEGRVDLSACSFEPQGERGVRVTGARFIPGARPTIKIEGAALRGYRTITVAGVRDPLAIASLDTIQAQVREAVASNLAGTLDAGDYTLRFIRYGRDGVLGTREPADTPAGHEIGLVIEAIAPTQELADTVLALARSTTLHQHYAGRKTTAGNLAFPFSPSDFQGGAVYEFVLYHLLEVEDDADLFPVIFEEV